MASSLGKGMQNRRGLINGGPSKTKDIDEENLRHSIDHMTYLAFAAMGIVFGALLALYLTGGI